MIGKLLKGLGGVMTKGGGTEKGVLSVIADKTGKISFKRSLPIVMVTYALGKSGIEGQITWEQIALCFVAGLIYVGGKYVSYLQEKLSAGKGKK